MSKVANWGWDDTSRGPWVSANYEGVMSCCGEICDEGDMIRADGEGGWEGQRCCYPEDDD